MPRYKLLIEYDGTPFVGWQLQDRGLSVQGLLMDAAQAFCGERVKVQGAGRTDAGVHALGQVAHVDLAKDWESDTVRDALTAHLRPHPIVVLAAEPVPDGFDARFSARQRHYRYRIVNRRPDLALERGRAWRVPHRLDEAAMAAAAQNLVGRHDFTTFRHIDCQAKSPVKTLDRTRCGAFWRRGADHGGGPLVPAFAGAFDGRRAGLGGRRPLDGRRSCGRARRAQPRRLRPGGAARGTLSGEGGLLRLRLAAEPVPGATGRSSTKPRYASLKRKWGVRLDLRTMERLISTIIFCVRAAERQERTRHANSHLDCGYRLHVGDHVRPRA